ncbi:hypothetical protein K8R78_02700 [bacterium]|nr:hypothetical protein [bacterium]
MRFEHVVLGIGLLAILFTGCFMGHMTTAKPVGAGKVGLTGSLGFVPFNSLLEEVSGDIDTTDSFGAMNLQGRLDIGLSDSVDLGFTTGVGVMIFPYWMGANAEVKYAFVNDPDSVTIAAGAGVGFNMSGVTAGGSLYIDSNIPFFPIHISARPEYAMGNTKDVDTDGDGVNDDTESEGLFYLNLAAGLHFDLSDTVRLLIEGTSFNTMSGDDQSFFKYWSFGAGVQFIL